jgi:hypothetical protein
MMTGIVSTLLRYLGSSQANFSADMALARTGPKKPERLLGERMKKVFFTPPPENYGPASARAILDGIRFSREVGFRPLIASKSIRSSLLLGYHLRLAASWNSADVFLGMYPYLLSPIRSENRLRTFDISVLSVLERLSNRNRSLLYVLDLPIELYSAIGARAVIDRQAVQIEERIFKVFDMLIVFNEHVKNAIVEKYSIPRNKFVLLEIFDHGVDTTPPTERNFNMGTRCIVYAGEWHESRVGKWPTELPRAENTHYEFSGKNWGWISSLNRDDLVYRGPENEHELCTYISTRADFGIIMTSSEGMKKYAVGNTSKFGLYLASGVPVLVTSECTHIASLVKKYDVGIVFNSLNEIPHLIRSLSTLEYNCLRKRCLRLGEAIRNGHFFKRAVRECLQRLGVNEPF